jgi:hypothetical protein
MATSISRLETVLEIEIVETHLTSPLTTVATPTTLVARRRRQNNKKRGSRKLVTKRSIDGKLVYSIFEPMHARFNFTVEGSDDDEGLNSHGDLPHCSPSDSILEREWAGERVFVNPPQ